MKTINEIKKEIEKLRMCLNTFLESSYDIEDFSLEDIYFEIINDKSSVKILSVFISNLKDYWKLKAQLQTTQEIFNFLKEEKEYPEYANVIEELKMIMEKLNKKEQEENAITNKK